MQEILGYSREFYNENYKAFYNNVRSIKKFI